MGGMNFYRAPIFGLLGLVAAAAQVGTLALELEHAKDESRWRRQRHGKGQNNRRGKGARSSPKARPNRLTVSKRVRRKHRRRAA